MSTQPATHNIHEYTVSEISGALKRTVEDTFSYVRIRGELSGFKRAASGHLYMDLKDDKAVLNAVCWKGVASKLPFNPEDGLEVIATGKLTTYPGRSNYQLVIDRMEPAGEGALMALLEKRKKELAAEGLFAPERKRPIPFLPQVIGVVTSPTGSVIRDILHRIDERFPVHVLVWPVRVQGDGAAEEIAAAIRGFNAINQRYKEASQAGDACREHGASHRAAQNSTFCAEHLKIDTLIVARGGGSIEDLWCFNEEIVVRAAADSAIPLISAVGHETDTTLIDYAADKRAPTPTAAAEFAVPVRRELMAALTQTGARLDATILRRLDYFRERTIQLARAIPNPQAALAHMTQRLDDWSERLKAALPGRITRQQETLARLRLSPAMLQQRLNRESERLSYGARPLDALVKRRIDELTQRMKHAGGMFDALNYKQVLKRGFAIVRGADGRVIRHAADAAQATSLQFADGEVPLSGNAPAAPKPKKPKAPAPANQESLF
jgi:exodeoxyribonuclease VII large subunit